MRICLKIVNEYTKKLWTFELEDLLAGAKGVPNYVTAYVEDLGEYVRVVTIVSDWNADFTTLPMPSNMSYVNMDI